MQGGPSCLLAMILLYGAGQADASVADGAHFIGHLPQGTVELVGITDDYRPTRQSRWWQPDGFASPIGPFRALQKYRRPELLADGKVRTFLVHFENLPADASTDAVGGVNSSTTPPLAHGLPWRGSLSLVPGALAYADAGHMVYGLPARARWLPARPCGRLPASTTLWMLKVCDTLNNARPSQPAATDRANAYARGYARGNTVPNYYKMFTKALQASAPTTDLRVGVSMGAWETVITRTADSPARRVSVEMTGEWR